MNEIIRLTDRTRIVSDWKCPQRRYLLTELGGRGITPIAVAEPLEIGRVWHSGTEAILHGEDYVEVARAAATQLPSEDWGMWIHAMLYACGKYILPEILADYEVLAIEQEMTKDLECVLGDPTVVFRYMAKPDLILRRKIDGVVVYWEWKTTGWTDLRWLRQWDKDVQLQATAAVIENYNAEWKVESCLVQGVYKGFRKEGNFYHPFVYAYNSGAGIAGISEGAWSLKYKPKWARVQTANYYGGLEGWVDYLWEEDPSVVRAQFPRTMPITINQRLIDRYFSDTLEREKAIFQHQGRPDLFPQHFTECEPGFGRKCGYVDVCWNDEIGKDPIGSGLYQLREPHHSTEVDKFAEEVEEG